MLIKDLIKRNYDKWSSNSSNEYQPDTKRDSIFSLFNSEQIPSLAKRLSQHDFQEGYFNHCKMKCVNGLIVPIFCVVVVMEVTNLTYEGAIDLGVRIANPLHNTNI